MDKINTFARQGIRCMYCLSLVLTVTDNRYHKDNNNHTNADYEIVAHYHSRSSTRVYKRILWLNDYLQGLILLC